MPVDYAGMVRKDVMLCSKWILRGTQTDAVVLWEL